MILTRRLNEIQVKITTYANSQAGKFNPEVKKAAREALRELAENPYHGKELQRELSGFWSYRFLRYRIVYQADPEKKIIVVWAIGYRRDIYETLGSHFL